MNFPPAHIIDPLIQVQADNGEQRNVQPIPQVQPIKTYLINLISGPSAGKTTIAALLFAQLKMRGFAVEYVQEVAKSYVWLEDYTTLNNQHWLSFEQFKKMNCLQGKVRFIITDGCLLHGLYYNRFNKDNVSNVVKTEQLIWECYNKFNNINIYIKRGLYPYETAGRYHAESEAKLIDEFLKKVMVDRELMFIEFVPDYDKNISELVTQVCELMY